MKRRDQGTTWVWLGKRMRARWTRPFGSCKVKGEAPAMPGWDRGASTVATVIETSHAMSCEEHATGGAQALLLSCIDPITRKDTWPAS